MMLALYRQLFANLHKQNIEYGVWKNTQELPDALSGEGDIDLYVYPASHRKFVAVLHSLRFIRLISHKSYPCVEHYYGFDAESGKFAHLHCYFRIVTGESHIKQYVIPIERYLEDYSTGLNEQGIREIHPLLLRKLNIFRRKIKLSCLPGAILFYRERHGYRQERDITTQGVLEVAGNSGVPEPSGWLAELEESPSMFQEIVGGLQYRLRFQHWNRFSPLLTPFHRYRAIVERLLGKLRKQKKTLPVGIILSITAINSATASNHEKMIVGWLKKHMNVRTFGNRGFQTALDALCVRTQTVEANRLSAAPSFRFLLGIAWQVWRRRGQVRQALRSATAGSIVIWSSQEAEDIKQALDAITLATPRKSWLKVILLRFCHVCLKLEPSVSIRLYIESSLADNLAVTAVGPSSGSLGLGTRLQSSPDGALQINVNVASINLSSDLGTLEEIHPDARHFIEKELWDKIWLLQC